MHTTDTNVAGLVEAMRKLESIVDDNDVCGLLRAAGRHDVADEINEWITQGSAHRIQAPAQTNAAEEALLSIHRSMFPERYLRAGNEDHEFWADDDLTEEPIEYEWDSGTIEYVAADIESALTGVEGFNGTPGVPMASEYERLTLLVDRAEKDHDPDDLATAISQLRDLRTDGSAPHVDELRQRAERLLADMSEEDDE